MDWINLFGLIILIFLFLPNIIYFKKNKSVENRYKNKVVDIIEQTGRYGSMFFMVFNVGLLEFGFRSKVAFVAWLLSSIILLLLYWGIWVLYFKSYRPLFSMLLAIIPCVIFISNGYFHGHWLLIICGIIFGISHIYITYQNTYVK